MIKILFIIIFFQSSCFAFITPDKIKRDLENKSFVVNEMIWDLDSLIIFNCKILENNESGLLVKIQVLKNLTNNYSSGIEANLKIIYKNEIMAGSPEILSMEYFEFNNYEYQNVINTNILWKDFLNALKSSNKEVIINSFSYPVKIFGSNILNKESILINYDSYFNEIKKYATTEDYFCFPKKESGDHFLKDDFILDLQISNTNDEENPIMTILLKAKRTDSKPLFYSIEAYY